MKTPPIPNKGRVYLNVLGETVLVAELGEVIYFNEQIGFDTLIV